MRGEFCFRKAKIMFFAIINNMLQILIYFFIFAFGLIIGSFLNCAIYRLKTEESIVSSRSHCVKCGHKLGWKDLIPVFSFLFLKGKCRYCSKKISWQYPTVEIATGLLFLLMAIYDLRFTIYDFSSFFELTFHLIIVSLLIIIFVYDLKHYLIPDKIIYLAITITFFWRIFQLVVFFLNCGGSTSTVSSASVTISQAILNPFVSALSASAFFAAIVLVSKEQWMGWGDVFIAFFMGLFLGFPNILIALFLAFTFGALVGIVLIAFGKKKMKSQVPFGPFLILATFASLFWGEAIIAWYLGLFIGI